MIVQLEGTVLAPLVIEEVSRAAGAVNVCTDVLEVPESQPLVLMSKLLTSVNPTLTPFQAGLEHPLEHLFIGVLLCANKWQADLIF